LKWKSQDQFITWWKNVESTSSIQSYVFFFFLSIALFWQRNLAGFRVLSIISKFWRWGANSAEVDFRRFVIYSIIDRENLTRTRCNDSDVCAEIAEREQVRQVRWTTLSGRVRRIKRRIYTAHLPTYLRVLSSFLPSSLPRSPEQPVPQDLLVKFTPRERLHWAHARRARTRTPTCVHRLCFFPPAE